MNTQTNMLAQEMGGGLSFGDIKVPEIIPIARMAAAEGIVLLKNEEQILPIKQGDKVAVFGRCAINYLGVGYGSGGDVKYPYLRNLYDGFRENGVAVDETLYELYNQWCSLPENDVSLKPDTPWGSWPMHYPEMELENEVVEAAGKRTDLAVVVIGRAAGEDRENKLEEGSYYLTSQEKHLLSQVTRFFSKVVVVMDCGNLIDMSWLSEYGSKIGGLLYAWQGGMESGNALADVLCGKVNPSGKLTDTIADEYQSYPSAGHFGAEDFNDYTEDIYVGYRYFETFASEKVLFPFGYGLSYTRFKVEVKQARIKERSAYFEIEINNTGLVAGKEVVQIYMQAPEGCLGKAKRELVGFAKTKELKPGTKDICTLCINIEDFASYDERGCTGYMSSWVLEKGDYHFCVGTDVRNAEEVCMMTLEKDVLIRREQAICPLKPEACFERMVNKGGQIVWEKVPEAKVDLAKRILAQLPEETVFSGEKVLSLQDVQQKNCTMEEFVAQLNPQDLEDLSRGEGKMNSPLGVAGNAGAFGGVTKRLRDLGIPPVITTDGPAGIRMLFPAALLPCGSALASGFNLELVEQLYGLVSKELKANGSDMLLAPGMNIHRNPLCGRNFEYFSEDPYLTGKMATAMVKGIQKEGGFACPKHFACNNQETKRNVADSRVSERALREIYLKGFGIVVKEAKPKAIMTSYNKINGVWGHYQYDLVEMVLRREWGFDGVVITDWWMQPAFSPEFPNLEKDAYRVRSGVDVLMPGNDSINADPQEGRTLLDTLGQADGITLGELQRTAKRVLKLCMYKLG